MRRRLVALGADDVPPAATTASWRSCHAARAASISGSPAPPSDSSASSATRLPPSTMSVPRPAMLVAMVTAPGCPACATIAASRACCLAFSTSCATPGLAEHAREQLRGLDRRGAHQHRLRSRRAVPDILQHRLELLFLGEEDEIGHVVADHVEVGGDDDDLQAVDLLEFRSLGVRGAGHARELLVEPEVVLEGDRGGGSGSRSGSAHLPWPRIAWCRPSDQRRPGIVRPVNSSTITISPLRTMYSTLRWNSACARNPALRWCTRTMLVGS